MTAKKFVLVHAVPQGEAPEWVRQAWVGLRLPLLTSSEGPKEWRAVGVLSAPRSFIEWLRLWLRGQSRRERGYAVAVVEAIELLDAARPDAAAWWRENTPHLVKPGRVFIFSWESCAEVDEVRPPAA